MSNIFDPYTQGMPSSIINFLENQTNSTPFGNIHDSPVIDIRNYKNADYAVECLIEIVESFEENIDPKEQAAIKYVQYGNRPILIDAFGYYNPSLIVIHGTTTNGESACVVQHISQVNLCLTAVKRANPEKPRRKIGFSSPDQAE